MTATAKSQLFYRVMCGRKAHSPWLDSASRAWKVAADKGLASFDRGGRVYPGPLVWLEVGRRERPKSRTVPQRTDSKGNPLPPNFLPPWPERAPA